LKFKRAPLSLIKRAMFALGFTPITALKLVNGLRLNKFRKNVKRGRGRGWMGQLFLSLRDVDWARTQAFSLGNFGQIYINTQGARPKGIVEPGAQYEAVRERIVREALDLRDPQTGDAVIHAAYRREELYHGARLDHAPDIILHTDRAKYVSFGHADFGSNQLIEPSIGQTGHHTMEGIVILRGAGIPAGTHLEGANIIDIAPTVLALMGLPVPSEMDGKVLFGMETRSTGAKEQESNKAGDENPYSEEDEEQVMERLRELGYVA
jgi:predicted AlkP superfamily phosphohydrolase/phosphomutase